MFQEVAIRVAATVRTGRIVHPTQDRNQGRKNKGIQTMTKLFSRRFVRNALVAVALAVAPAASFAGVFISVGFAPPALPVYVQPAAPADGYLWQPGYWAYGPEGYYWVPGVWVQPPVVGVLWTPGYWGWRNGLYAWNEGYWGPHVGFYGGINYGFGYGGVGFFGGRWNGGHFAYNTAVVNVNRTFIHNTYIDNTHVTANVGVHTAFNGGAGGLQARPSAEEQQWSHENHLPPTAEQQQHVAAAHADHSNFASANGGHPQNAAFSRPGSMEGAVPARGANPARDGFGHANEVNARQGNQQARINAGVRSGQLTPGETNNLETRDSSINRQAQADRAANGGRLTGQEKQQLNQRQNAVSNSIHRDDHNANNDRAAAARNGATPHQEKQQAQHVEKKNAPHPGEDHPKER